MSACHVCKLKVFHYRQQEHKTLMPFYNKHLEHGGKYSVETKEDQKQEEDWMSDEEYGGYKTDEEIQRLGERKLSPQKGGKGGGEK